MPEISPISLDVVLTLSQSKTRARAAKIIYKRLKKQQSSSSLDFTDVAILAVGRVSTSGADPAVVISAGGADPADVVVSASGADSASTFISAGILVTAGPSVLSAPSSPIRDPAKGKAIATPSSPVTASSDKELADQQAVIFEAERQELLEQELKQSLNAEQVYLDNTMLVPQGEGSGTPTEPHHTPSPEAHPTSHTTHSSPTHPPVTTASIPTVTPSETTPIRQYTRKARIAQSSTLPTIADEPASPLRDVSQVSIAETTSTELPPLKDKSMWSDQEKRIQKIDRLARYLLIQGLSNDIYSLIDSNKTAKDL
nr:hypothetical protein [Tanacetum cinerariifolium]